MGLTSTIAEFAPGIPRRRSHSPGVVRPSRGARSLRGMVRRAGPGATGAVAAGVFLGGAWLARRAGVTAAEARFFRAVNTLPKRAFVPVWAAMQVGSLGGAMAASAAVWLLGDARVGRRMAAVGSLTWLGAKAVKPLVRRGRPAAVVDVARVLGREQTGLGYPSGHAAVSAALAAVAAPHVPPRWRGPLWTAALLVGPARMYVGAHLPLDVAGGVALGLAVGTVAR